MTGFFGEWDIAGAADDPFNLPVGTYKGAITEFDGDISGEKKEGGGDYRGVQWTLTVSEGDQEGGTFDAYFPLPVGTTPVRNAGMMRSNLKKFLAGLEVPVENMNTIDGNDLLNYEVIWTVVEKKNKKNRTFKNLGEIRLANGSEIYTGDSDGSGMDVFTPSVDEDEFGLS